MGNRLSQEVKLSPTPFTSILPPDPPQPWTFYKHLAISVATAPVAMMSLVIVLSPFSGLLSNTLVGVLATTLALATGLAGGYLVPRGREYATARWVWIPPLSLFLICFYWEATLMSLSRALAAYFWPSKGDEGVGLLISFPVASAVLYSIGAELSYIRMSRRARLAAKPIGDTKG